MVDRAMQTGIRAFATQATYVPATGSSYPITGVFNRHSVEVNPETGAAVETAKPTLFVRLADMQAPFAPGDKLTLSGVTYRIKNSDDDGEGGTLLTLSKQG